MEKPSNDDTHTSICAASSSSSSSKSDDKGVTDDVTTVSASEIKHAVNRVLADRKQAILDEMRARIDSRRKNWDAEVDKMRRDFFRLKPATNGSSYLWKEPDGGDSGSPTAFDRRQRSTVSDTGSQFLVCFDVSAFQPEEISVRTEDRKLIVHALHEEKSPDGRRTTKKEFNRQVDIPRHLQPEAMQCTLTGDGVLRVEGEVVQTRASTDCVAGNLFDKMAVEEEEATRSRPHATPHSDDEQVRFAISVNMGQDFGPEDVEVKTVDRKVVVTARLRAPGHDGKTAAKEFHREFELPATIDPISVTANMTEEGLLMIEAPFTT